MKYSGIAFLLFLAPVSSHAIEPDSCVHLNEVVVTGLTGNTHISRSPSPVSVISAQQLSVHSSTNIIDAIAKQPGVSQVSTGSGISKPVIRGLGYNRVLVVNDGIRQEGQQWGDEHGIEIDPNSVHSVEIMKGPASLMYGSDALAGVLIMKDAPLLPEGEMDVEAMTEYQTNNGLWAYSLSTAGHKNAFVWDWHWSQKMAHDYKNRYDGRVPGSRFSERALSGMFGLNGAWGYSHLKLGYYHLTPGIIEGERDEETGELLSEDNGKHYGRLAPFQQVKHYKAVIDNQFRIGEGRLKTIIGYQQNRRQEFEEADECELDFMLHTLNYDIRYVAPEFNGVTMNVGVGGMYQRSLNKGEEFLIPSYNLFDFGVFATASKSYADRLHISGGLRYDTRHLHSNALEEEGEMRFEQFSRSFNGLTGSIGVVYNVSRNTDLRFNIARGFRAPNMSEMGSNGVHEGTLRYEIGNHELSPEFSWQADLGLDFSTDIFSLQLSLFANRISNFIYLQRDGTEIEGMPVYQNRQGTARLLGGEARAILHPFHHLHWENTFSYVDSRLLDKPKDERYLPFTPAPRWLSTIHYDFQHPSSGHQHSTRLFNNAFVELEMDCNLRQNHFLAANETETATPSYTLFNFTAGTDIQYHSKKIASLYLTVANIFDRAYQNHLSRLKYADINNVTGRMGVFNMGRNISLKLIVPLSFAI